MVLLVLELKESDRFVWFSRYRGSAFDTQDELEGNLTFFARANSNKNSNIALLPLCSHSGYPVVLMSEINEVQVALTANETNETIGWPWPHFPHSNDPTVGVDQGTYDNLVRYTKYASGAYQVLCPRPMGNTLILQVSANVVTWRLTLRGYMD